MEWQDPLQANLRVVHCKLHDIMWHALRWKTVSTSGFIGSVTVLQELLITWLVQTTINTEIKLKSTHAAQPLCSQFKRTHSSSFQNSNIFFLICSPIPTQYSNSLRAETLKAISPSLDPGLDRPKGLSRPGTELLPHTVFSPLPFSSEGEWRFLRALDSLCLYRTDEARSLLALSFRSS